MFNKTPQGKRGFTQHHVSKKYGAGFTLIEIIVAIAAVGFVASAAFALLTDTRLNAHDKKRVEDLKLLQRALNLYVNDHGHFPRESDGMNGNTATNQIFLGAILPYLDSVPEDPTGGTDTFHYYYDGAHRCGNDIFAMLIARQMEKTENANYEDFKSTTCGGFVDGEGRGGGRESYNIIVGLSGG